MKPILQSKVRLLIIMFFAISLTSYAGTGVKPDCSIKKDYKQEHKSLKGACNCYKQSPVKALNKYRKMQKKTSRQNR